MSETNTPATTQATPAAKAPTAPKADKAPKAAPAAKAAKTPKATGNLSLEEARAGVLKALKDGRKSVSALRKGLVPYGNYSALMRGLEQDGLVQQAEGKLAGDSSRVY